MNENTFARTDETSIGFKACHSESEGWSIAAGAERNGMQCVAVALGCGDTDSRFALAKQLLRKGFAGWKVVQPGFSGNFSIPSRSVAAWNVPCWQNRDGSRHWSSHGAAASWKP